MGFHLLSCICILPSLCLAIARLLQNARKKTHRCGRFSRIILQLATKRNVCLNGMACKKKGGAGMRCVVINHYTDLLGVLRGRVLVLLVPVPREATTLCSYCEAQDIVTTSRGRCDKPERQSDCASLLAYKEVLMY